MSLPEARLRSSKPPHVDGFDRDEVADYFRNTWELYELLFSSIRGDGALYVNPDPLRQPLIFYLGHTAAFYVNKLRLARLIETGVREDFERLFAVGVDPATAAELGAETWPSESEVREYRAAVFDLVLEVIQSVQANPPFTPESPMWALFMGLEHDRIHFETSSVLIRQYPTSEVGRPEGWEYGPIEAPPAPARPVRVAGRRVTLGRPDDAAIFGWDNEYGRLPTDVDDFTVMSNPVTNGEFLEFWRDGGYGRRELWSDEGWRWRTETGASAPRFWVADADDTSATPGYRAMFDDLALPMSWPVEVNRLEATAFCRWKGDAWRLPTEAEFQVMALRAPAVDGDPLFAGVYNIDLAYGSPTPVGSMTGAATPEGINDLFGNVWEWLRDDFYAFPGYTTHPLYRDYSEPFMDSDHSMLAGGSWASTGTSASKHYRQWFRRHFYQHAGFRLARGS